MALNSPVFDRGLSYNKSPRTRGNRKLPSRIAEQRYATPTSLYISATNDSS